MKPPGPHREPEQGRRLAGLYGLGDETRFGERLDRAPRGINHAWFGVQPRIRDGTLRAAPSTTWSGTGQAMRNPRCISHSR